MSCRAPAFPLQDFHDQLLLTEKVLGNQSILDEIVEKLRPIMAERTGAGFVADSHFRRADQFLQTKQILRAMRELHETRIKWFSQETLGDSVLCCLLLASCYEQLELNFAAIYYAHGAAFIAINSGDDEIKIHATRALLAAAHSAYSQGHWCLYFELAGTALAARYHLVPEAFDLDSEPNLKPFVGNLVLGLAATRRLVPGIFDALMSEVRSWGMEELMLDGMAITAVPLTEWNETQFETALHKSCTGPPFADAGPRCEAMWQAHGVRWWMRWENRYEVLRVATEVVAFFQIALAELAASDLDIVPGTVVADFELTDGNQLTAEELPDNDVHRWRFRVPREPLLETAGVDTFRPQVLGCFVHIVRSISLMPLNRFLEVLGSEAGPRLFRNDFFARRFPELFDTFLGSQRFGFLGRNTFACPLDLQKWQPKCAPELTWRSSVHPQFDEAAELDRVRRRYNVGLAGLKYTTARLKHEPEVCSTIRDLKSKGWKDWHVLSAVLNIIANYRLRRRFGESMPSGAYEKALKEEISAPEREDSLIVPAELFQMDALEMNLLMVIVSSLSRVGLEFHERFPKRDGLLEYVRHRWRYFDLDMPHPAIFDAN